MDSLFYSAFSWKYISTNTFWIASCFNFELTRAYTSVTTIEIYATPDNIKIGEQIMNGNKELEIDLKYNENEKTDLKEWLNNLC